MQKALVILIGLGIVGLGAWWWAGAPSSTGDEMAATESRMDTAEEGMMKKPESMMPEKGERYAVYTTGVLENDQEARRVLFFYASWCPFCRPADAEFKEKMSAIPDDVKVIRVNYNDSDTDQEEKDLAQKYGVTYQHTFVQIDGEGRAVNRWNGGQLAELLKNVK